MKEEIPFNNSLPIKHGNVSQINKRCATLWSSIASSLFPLFKRLSLRLWQPQCFTIKPLPCEVIAPAHGYPHIAPPSGTVSILFSYK